MKRENWCTNKKRCDIEKNMWNMILKKMPKKENKWLKKRCDRIITPWTIHLDNLSNYQGLIVILICEVCLGLKVNWDCRLMSKEMMKVSIVIMRLKA